MKVLNWNDIPSELVTPLQTRQVIHTPHSTIVRLVSLKGAVVPMHHHVHEQVTMLESGCFRFEVQGETAVLRRGDVLRIESDVPHLAEALEDTVTIELFVPARKDWIGGGQPIVASSSREAGGS
jgi:quercetin dioxygenase-like cupin family protein